MPAASPSSSGTSKTPCSCCFRVTVPMTAPPPSAVTLCISTSISGSAWAMALRPRDRAPMRSAVERIAMSFPPQALCVRRPGRARPSDHRGLCVLFDGGHNPGPVPALILQAFLQHRMDVIGKVLFTPLLVHGGGLVLIQLHRLEDGFIITYQVRQLNFSFGQDFLEIAAVRWGSPFLSDNLAQIGDMAFMIQHELAKRCFE